MNSGSAYTREVLRQAVKDRIIDNDVMALGGINLDNILEIKDFGFGGGVIAGDLWNKFDFRTDHDYNALIRHFKELRKMAD